MVKKENYNSFRWYGFDLDGTIADNSLHGFGMGVIGKPIVPMCNLMKRLHSKGCRVKIVTARLNDVGSSPEAQRSVRNHIWRWCDTNLGFRPEITDRKDGSMECLYDDRARQVVRNRGADMGVVAKKLAKALEGMIENPREAKTEAIGLLRRCRSFGLL